MLCFQFKRCRFDPGSGAKIPCMACQIKKKKTKKQKRQKQHYQLSCLEITETLPTALTWVNSLIVSSDLEGMLRARIPQHYLPANLTLIHWSLEWRCVRVMCACDTWFPMQEVTSVLRSRQLPLELICKKAHAQQVYAVQTLRLGKRDLSALKVRKPPLTRRHHGRIWLLQQM